MVSSTSPRTSRPARAQKCLTPRQVALDGLEGIRLPGHCLVPGRIIWARLVFFSCIREMHSPREARFRLDPDFLSVLGLISVPYSVNEVLNKTSFGIVLTSWLTIDLQSRSTPRLRMDTGLFSVLSVTVNRCMVSIHSRSCLSTSLSSKSRSFPMTSGATFTVLFNRAMLFIPSLVSSCCTKLDRTSRSNGTGSPLAKSFISAAVSTGRSGCPGIGCPDLSNHLVSGSLS